MASDLENLLTPAAQNAGYDIVRVRLSGGDRHKTLQIMAERKDGRPMTVDDCALLSRAFEPVLDETDPISGRYTLEVSSPGLDRPLVKLADFDRFKGFEAKLETSLLLNGRKRFRGKLAGVDGANVVIVCDGNEIAVPFDAVAQAKLVLTDELIEAFASADKE